MLTVDEVHIAFLDGRAARQEVVAAAHSALAEERSERSAQISAWNHARVSLSQGNNAPLLLHVRALAQQMLFEACFYFNSISGIVHPDVQIALQHCTYT